MGIFSKLVASALFGFGLLPSAQEQEELQPWIEKLSGDDIGLREHAWKKIVASGAKARSAVVDALAKKPDPELKELLESALDRIDRNLLKRDLIELSEEKRASLKRDEPLFGKKVTLREGPRGLMVWDTGTGRLLADLASVLKVESGYSLSSIEALTPKLYLIRSPAAVRVVDLEHRRCSEFLPLEINETVEKSGRFLVRSSDHVLLWDLEAWADSSPSRTKYLNSDGSIAVATLEQRTPAIRVLKSGERTILYDPKRKGYVFSTNGQETAFFPGPLLGDEILSPDGKYVWLGVPSRHSVQMVDFRTAATLWTAEIAGTPGFSSDGECATQIWNGGFKVRHLKSEHTVQDTGTILFLQKDRLVTSKAHQSMAFWDLSSGKPIFSLETSQCIVSPCKRFFAVTQSDGSAKVYEPSTGKEYMNFSVSPPAPAEKDWMTSSAIAFSSTGRFASLYTYRHSKEMERRGRFRDIEIEGEQALHRSTLTIWDLSSRRQVYQSDSARKTAWSPRGDALGIMDLKIAYVWTPEQGKSAEWAIPSNVYPCPFLWSGDGKRLCTLTGSGFRKCAVRELPSLNVLQEWQDQIPLSFAGASGEAIASWGEHMEVTIQEQGEVVRDSTLMLAAGREEYARTALGDSGGLLAVGRRNQISIYDLKTAQELKRFDLPEENLENGHRVSGLAFDAKAKRLAALSTGTGLRVWDVESGKVLLTQLKGSTRRGLAFESSGRRLVYLTSDSEVRFVDVDRGVEISATPLRLKETEYAGPIALSPEGRHLAVTIYDRESGHAQSNTELRIYSLTESGALDEIHRFRSAGSVVDPLFTKDGKHLSVTDSGRLRVFELRPLRTP